MSEDCLQLGVFTPGSDGRKRPVLVHIYGGGFQRGSANTGYINPAALSSTGDVVVVRVGFRTGAWGWMYLGDVMGRDFEHGNVALLDVVAALRWIQANIGSLGGDPQNVTLFGLSSGAFMTAALMTMPVCAGLFHRGWMMSGSASRIVRREDATRLSCEILARLGIRTGDKSALNTVPPQELLYAQEKSISTDVGLRNAPGGMTLGVVLDGHTLTRHPLEVLQDGGAVSRQMVLGTTLDETRLWFVRNLMARLESEEQFVKEIELYVGAHHAGRLAAAYASDYPALDLEQRRERFLTHAIYRIPALRTAAAQARSGGQAYLYRFDWTPPEPWAQWGASHAFDEPFIWGGLDIEATPYALGDAAKELSSQMTCALVAFARCGNPGWRSHADGSGPHIFGSHEDSEGACSTVMKAWCWVH